jgi:hypothetical protein
MINATSHFIAPYPLSVTAIQSRQIYSVIVDWTLRAGDVAATDVDVLRVLTAPKSAGLSREYRLPNTSPPTGEVGAARFRRLSFSPLAAADFVGSPSPQPLPHQGEGL